MGKQSLAKEGALTAVDFRSRFHYDPETGIFMRLISQLQWKAGQPAGYLRNGYWFISIGHRTYRAHRLAWLYMTGEWPPEEIDHRNMNREDNRWSNLRLASSAENLANKKSRAKSGFKGVYWIAGKWQASIQIGGKANYLGRFLTAEEAGAAYAAAAKNRWGEFANLGNDGD